MENAQEIIEEYHRDNPNKPGPRNRIRATQITHDQEKCLFDPTTNVPGRDFIMPPSILDLTSEILICLDMETINHFVNTPGDPNLLWLMPTTPPMM